MTPVIKSGSKCAEGHILPLVWVDWGSHIMYVAPNKCDKCGDKMRPVKQ